MNKLFTALIFGMLAISINSYAEDAVPSTDASTSTDASPSPDSTPIADDTAK